jgi:hypothetical protein
MPIRLLLALVALVVVSGCAPGATGGRDNPVDLARDRAVTAAPGATVYVRASFEAPAFGYRIEDLPGRWVPWGPDTVAASLTALFTLRDVVAPDGWNLEIDQVRGYDRLSQEGVALEATLRLTVPESARAGGQRVRGVMVAQNGQRRTIEIVVQVAR